MGFVEKPIESSKKSEQPGESQTPSTADSEASKGRTRLERLGREIAQAMVDSLNRHTANLPD